MPRNEVQKMANEKRLIDANKLLRNYEMWIPQLTLPQDQRDKDAIETCIAVLKDQPTVDAVEVVHGRLDVSYIDEYYGEFANCLECGTDNILPCHYCRNCGARMDGERRTDGKIDT